MHHVQYLRSEGWILDKLKPLPWLRQNLSIPDYAMGISLLDCIDTDIDLAAEDLPNHDQG